ncbi:uncharacterized protein LOC115965954 isoform X2 [Quercus lobata]|uniref:uncharacterized protein LOC115965954 isoform X2 n=1 Tax=Quercus lobata TaxID=97700 RepID=UPI00124795D2|nr:uncharacterized protein LOC115965954 isoform X2 [Quercus lobata]
MVDRFPSILAIRMENFSNLEASVQLKELLLQLEYIPYLKRQFILWKLLQSMDIFSSWVVLLGTIFAATTSKITINLFRFVRQALGNG